MAHNFESKAAKKLVEAFYLESLTDGAFTNKYDWEGVDTIRLRSVDVVDLNQYNWQKTDGSRFGTLTEIGDTYQALTVNQDYAYNIAIDKRNNTSTLMEKAAGSVAAREIREVLVPMVDEYNLAAIANGHGVTGFGSTGGGQIRTNCSLSKSNVLEHILTSAAMMNNRKVPKKGRVLWVKETEAIKVHLADQIFGSGATAQTTAQQIIKSGSLGSFAGMQIVPVPDDMMPDGVLYMIVLKDSVVAPKKIETMRILTQHPDIDGAVTQGRFLFDCFVIGKKADGVLVARSDAGGATGETGA